VQLRCPTPSFAACSQREQGVREGIKVRFALRTTHLPGPPLKGGARWVWGSRSRREQAQKAINIK